MSRFYVSIIFVGIILIIISFIWVLIDKKKMVDYETKLKEKKNDLLLVIDDAETMLTELNKFSDYVVTRIEQKSKEVKEFIGNLDERCLEEKIAVNQGIKNNFIKKETNNSDKKQVNFKKQGINEKINSGIKNDSKEICGTNTDVNTETKISDICSNSNNDIRVTNALNSYKEISKGINDKVIPFNTKQNHVIHLYEKGYTNTEIAKKLNIGKGEIQLILEMNK